MRLVMLSLGCVREAGVPFRLVSFFAALTALLGFSSHAEAYSYIDNRGLLPLGEVESFMANTGVALSGSTGSVYYNPAGLASLQQNKISLSANSYLSTKSRIDSIQKIDGVDMLFETKGLQTIPSSFVSTGHLDQWSYAFSVLVPHQIKVQDAVSYSTPSYPSLQYARTNAFQLLMAGGSIAKHFENGFDFGAGCFYTLYSTTQSSILNGGVTLGTNALVSNSYFDAQVTGVTCNAGLQKDVSENLRFGFTARLPMIQLAKQGRASEFVQDPTSGKSRGVGPQDVDPDYRLPVDFSLGFEYRAATALRVYLDVSQQQAVTYSSGDLEATPSDHKAVLRASAGLRYLASTEWELYAGAGYNPSSVNANQNDYAENFVTGTLGVRWLSGNSSFGVGALYAQSSGEKSAPIYNAALTNLGAKTISVSTQAIGVMISSGYVF